jgi:hypothetical protein
MFNQTDGAWYERWRSKRTDKANLQGGNTWTGIQDGIVATAPIAKTSITITGGNEDLVITPGVSANTVGVSSSTGVTTIYTAPIVIVSPPAPTVTKSVSGTLTVNEVLSGSVYLTTVANTNVQTLPQTAATTTATQMGDGCIVCFYNTTANGAQIKPDGADTFYLNGVAQSAGQSIINTTKAIGDYICVQAIAGNKIYTWGSSGVWANGY